MSRVRPAPWRIVAEGIGPPPDPAERRLALEVDPRSRTVRLGVRVVGSTTLDVQSGAVARSFFEHETAGLGPAAAWLAGEDAAALLEQLAAGYTCDVLWTGDPVVRWSDDAWEAGHALYVRVAALLEVG